MRVPHREFRPEELTYPFEFPVVTVHGDSVSAFRTPKHFGLAGEKVASEGVVPDLEIFTQQMERWKPIDVRSVCDTKRAPFGRRVYYAEYDYAIDGTYELDDLREGIIARVEDDPDDLWSQELEHEEVVRILRAASNFMELLQALVSAGAVGS